MPETTVAPVAQSYAISIIDVPAQPLAVVKTRATASTLSASISECLPQIWTFLQLTRVENPGINVVIYSAADGADYFDIEVGARVNRQFHSQPPIYFSSTPAGRVATATHVGHYHLLGQAHAAIQQWCRDNHHRLAGPSWEIYGHWTSDPAELRTEVYYLLA